ncbi:MAG: hypothetical protein V3W41_21975 [Planctomycetota bacterium]
MALTTIAVTQLSTANDRVGIPRALETLRDESEVRIAALEAGVAAGDIKPSVRAASNTALAAYTRTANVITADANGALSAQDGITLVAGEEFLLKDGAAGADNGPQVITQIGDGSNPFILTRRATENTSAEVTGGMVVPINEGTLFADTAFKLTTNDPITLNTTALTFAQIPWGFGAAPGETGSAGAAGTSTATARLDHVHKEHTREARYVMTTDVPSLAAFVLAQDGVTGAEGEIVLLVGQTSKDENGPYIIGTVSGTAPLTRPAWWPAAASVQGGYELAVAEGTIFADTKWFISTNGAVVVDTTAHDWYPRSVTQSVVLTAGTVTIATVPILSLTKSNVLLTRQIANTSTATDGGYHPTTGGSTGLTAGVVGTAAAIIEACVAAGTINAADISTLHATIIN